MPVTITITEPTGNSYDPLNDAVRVEVGGIANPSTDIIDVYGIWLAAGDVPGDPLVIPEAAGTLARDPQDPSKFYTNILPGQSGTKTLCVWPVIRRVEARATRVGVVIQ